MKYKKLAPIPYDDHIKICGEQVSNNGTIIGTIYHFTGSIITAYFIANTITTVSNSNVNFTPSQTPYRTHILLPAWTPIFMGLSWFSSKQEARSDLILNKIL